ncbi:MAG TPA: hypothetical protein VMH87_04120 [Pseudomonadales bacterium]|nr:hypothetical protein [Pseudomonadales bacterium]
MKILNRILFSFSVGLLGILSISSVQAQTTTVLDNFSESTVNMPPGTTTNGFSPANCTFDGARGYCNTNIALFTAYGGRSASGQVLISQYTATAPNDPFVTQGTNAMAITFLASGFGNDLQIVLSDTNSYLVEKAAASGQIARYILRYDVIFANPSQFTYFNQHVYIGASQEYLSIGGATPVTANASLGVYSCALELPALGLPLPNTGTNVQLVIADDFGTTQSTFTNCTIYIGNIRLVDTYASSSTVPVIYPLVSFKNGISVATNLYPTVNTFYGNPVTSRAHLSLYVTNGLYNSATDGIANVCTTNYLMAFPHYTSSPNVTDFTVTENDGVSLAVSNSFTGSATDGYEADFAVSFAGTKLAQILSQNLPLPELAHYTLRWDTTMPEVWSFEDGVYANMTYSTGLAALPMCQGRRSNFGQSGLQRDTYSVTLDQIAAWGGAPAAANPAMIFFFDAEDLGGPYIYYFDNFELIDTTPAAAAAPVITSWQYNSVTHKFTLTWTSQSGANYTVLYAASVQSAFTPLVTNIPSGGATTTTTVTLPAGQMGYLQIKVQ